MQLERVDIQKHPQTLEEIKSLCGEALRTGGAVEVAIRDDEMQKGKPMSPEITTTTLRARVLTATDTTVTFTLSLGSGGNLDSTVPFEDIVSISLVL